MSKREIAVDALRHKDKRRNIPTAELEPVMDDADKSPIRLAYERRNRDLDPQLVWHGKDEQDWSDLIVQAPPLYIQEKVHPKVLIDDLLRQSKQSKARRDEKTPEMPDLFADFNGLPDKEAVTEFYQHDANWSNRMILGDSLSVMASLAEREGLRGKVQCIYIDPPYGIRFNSNFQWSTTTRDVKDGNKDHITREPEQVKAFRDTWRDGIHSYLTYLRDRLTVARDLLADSGSIFMQIGDENVHRVRALMDEVLGDKNYVCTLLIQKTGTVTGEFVQSNTDVILWYTRTKEHAKFRPLFLDRPDKPSVEILSKSLVDRTDYSAYPLTSDGFRDTTTVPFVFEDRSFHPGVNRHWGVRVEGLQRAGRAGRIIRQDTQVRMKYFWDDFPVRGLGAIWADVGGATGKVYVVQTTPKVLQRLLLMTTDPGDLVLDPTCGSGTTSYVAEQWGRRWITIDTSRVALALARTRIMGAALVLLVGGQSRGAAQGGRGQPHAAKRDADARRHQTGICLRAGAAHHAEVDRQQRGDRRDVGEMATRLGAPTRAAQRRDRQRLAGMGNPARG
jgi:adenine-specific DNA-methyltransferase